MLNKIKKNIMCNYQKNRKVMTICEIYSLKKKFKQLNLLD